MEARVATPVSGSGAEQIDPVQAADVERTNLFVRSSVLGTLTGLAVAALYASMIDVELPGRHPFFWLWLMLVSSVARLCASALYLVRRPTDARQLALWRRCLAMLALSSGVLWGCGAVWFYSGAASPELAYIHAFVLAGVVAGSLSSLSAYWPAYLLFAGPGLGIFAADRFLQWESGMAPTYVLGVAGLLYLGLLLSIAWQYQATILLSLRRRIEIEQLARGLARARDEAEAANRSKTQFLANASHEIRTPMNAVMGLSELMMGGHLPSRYHRYAAGIHDAAKSLLSVVNDVLDVSRIESGEVEMRPVPVDPAAVLRQVRDLMRPLADQKGLALDLEIAPGVPDCVLADPGRLRQILVNLAGNAVKFTRKGGVTLRLEASSAEAHSVRLRFHVVDTGPGIDREDQDRLFRRYSQLDGTDTRTHGGTGLGLFVARDFARRMGGDIILESRPGAGARFILNASFELAEAARPQPPAMQVAQPAGAAHAPARILLVEDNEINQEVARVMLEGAGHAVVVAPDGEQALARLREGRFDCVLMDCEMPGAGGIATARRMRDDEGSLGRMPIVALTANAMQGAREHCLEAGMDDFLSKPFSRAELLDCVARNLGARLVPRVAAPVPR